MHKQIVAISRACAPEPTNVRFLELLGIKIPLGYEDSKGFHFGNKSKIKKKSR